MRYIIMADGKMSRWRAESDTPKHLLQVDGETLLSRLVRQLDAGAGDEVIITSHDPRYEVPGARRYEPRNNQLEIGRFTWELIEDDCCFLYGDTYYTDEAVRAIRAMHTDRLHFFGNRRSIVAVLVGQAELLRSHIRRVTELYLTGEIDDCRGWQVYQSYTGLPFGVRTVGPAYTLLTDGTQGFNTVAEYQAFCAGK